MSRIVSNVPLDFFRNYRDMLPVNNVEAREKVERLYVYLQIYHRLHCSWWNWTLPGTTFSLSTTVILGMYVGLRHTELPWYLYWIFWFAAFGVLTQIFGVGHDVVFTKDDSEEVVEKLQSPASSDLVSLSLEERREILKPCRAMTGLRYGIAGFANYSWAVPLGAWDEILNQLLFLLSL